MKWEQVAYVAIYPETLLALKAVAREGEQVSKLVKETGMVTGKFWTEALARYAVEKPKLRIYGEE